MIPHQRPDGEGLVKSLPVLRWQVWRLPALPRSYMLAVEALVLAVTALLIAQEPAHADVVIRACVLLGLGIAYSEIAAHSTRMQRFLGNDAIFSNPKSVWSYAAVVVLPAGWAAGLIMGQYGHALWQRRRDRAGHPYRVMFSAGAAIAGQLAVAGLLGLSGTTGVVGQLAAVAGIGVFLGVDMVVLLTGMWLTVRPPSIRALLPDTDTLGYEVASLVLGLATAQFVLHSPVLTPAVLVVVALLQRSSVVKKLQQSARTDAKTGLLTAAAWSDEARATLSRADRAGAQVAVLMLDLDHFKAVNDTHGHLAGDRLLAAVSASLRGELRGHDGIGRFGGEELVAVLEGVGVADAFAVADRVRESVSRIQLDGGLSVTTSIGLAHSRDLPQGLAPAAALEALLERADLALYEAKHAGRNRVGVLAG